MKLLRPNLRVRLLLTYLLVIGVGALTVVLATSLIAPRLYDLHMAGMMAPASPTAPGAGSMMGGQSDPGGMMQGTDAAIRSAYQQSVVQSVLVGVAAAVLVAVAVSLFVSNRIAGPVQRMVRAAGRIAAGHYGERVPVPDGVERSTDEISRLATSFNEMAGSLEQTEQRRIDLLGDVAHELRTPINTLQGYLEGLLDGVIPATPELWAKMHSESGRMQRLVNDLQDLSRTEARQLSLKVEPLAPFLIARLAADNLQQHYAEKGLVLHVQVAPALPPVLADRDRAVQVLTNLLSNALRYTPAPGTVTLTVSASESAQGVERVQKDEVLFCVADSGVGISPEHLPHLFERFYRVDKSRSRAAGGSGIGLTIAQALTEAMGGRIWAESPGPGMGSTFYFTLPASR